MFLHLKKKRNSVQLILHGIKLLLWSRQPYSVGVFITASGQSLVIVTQLHSSHLHIKQNLNEVFKSYTSSTLMEAKNRAVMQS